MMKHSPPKLNPFLYGKPVPPDRFHGRQSELQTLFSRIATSQSTAIIGEPQIGKSSLKRYIYDESVRWEWLEEESNLSLFLDIDCHLLPASYDVGLFWRDLLNRVGKRLPSGALGYRFTKASQEMSLDFFTWQALFRDLGLSGQRVVVLLDEFDSLVGHPNLNSTDFFGPLRTIANNTSGLVVVTASRLSVSEINRRTSSIGSPLANNMIEIKLPALSESEVDELLAATLEGSGIEMAVTDRSFIRRVAGRHPFLVQAAGATLFDAVLAVGPGETKRYERAAEMLRLRTEAHFDDAWRHLESEAQIAMVILALAEVGSQVEQRDFDVGGLGSLNRYEKELRDLERRGLIEIEGDKGWNVDWGYFSVWHGTRWRVGAGSFVWWIVDHAIAGTREKVDFTEWLQQRELEGLLTRGEKARIREMWSRIPQQTIESAGTFVGTALRGFFT